MAWPFKPPPIVDLQREQLYEAQRQLLLYETAAEHQTTMANMYRRRVERLQAEIRATVAASPHLEPTLRERTTP